MSSEHEAQSAKVTVAFTIPASNVPIDDGKAINEAVGELCQTNPAMRPGHAFTAANGVGVEVLSST